RLEGGDNEDGKELDRIDIEKARQWENRLNHLHTRYATLVNLHVQAQQQYQEAQERLKWLTDQRVNGTGPFAALQTLDLDMSQSSMRRSRHRTSLTSNVSSPIPFPQVETAFSRSTNFNPASNSPTFPPTTAFFNINNGMTLAGLADRSEALPTESDASLPPMSPRADALLPSDLLGDEESPELPESVVEPTIPDDDGAAGPSLDQQPRSPSPVPSDSMSSRFFASPHDSLRDTELNIPTSERMSPDDAANVQAESRRLSGLFNFHR
ncbi:hypothetical protein F66182_15181, partial [Fusarium sp. NRRL 66182]